MQIRISSPLEVFCSPLMLYTTKFQGKRSNLRCDPPEQEKLQVMKMLTKEFREYRAEAVFFIWFSIWVEKTLFRSKIPQTHSEEKSLFRGRFLQKLYDLGFSCQYNLKRGVKEMYRFYDLLSPSDADKCRNY